MEQSRSGGQGLQGSKEHPRQGLSQEFEPEVLDSILQSLVEIREEIIEDADATVYGAMFGCPAEIAAFALRWIQRAKGKEPKPYPGWQCTGFQSDVSPEMQRRLQQYRQQALASLD